MQQLFEIKIQDSLFVKYNMQRNAPNILPR